MVHDTTPRRRHLRVVGDTEHTDGVELGVTYEEPAPAVGPAPRKVAAEPLEGRLVQPDETAGALTPKRAALEGVNARLKASLEAGHTYAMLAWARWMDTTTNYVMDPHLREDVLDEAEKALDDKRVRAARQVTRSLEPAKRAAAEREVERLKRRTVSELEVDARVLKARGVRLAKRFTIPAGVVAGPVIALTLGGPILCVLAWPAAWAWLALQGRAHARAELGAAPAATELEEKARHLATTTAPAATGAPAPAGQAVRVVGADAVEAQVLRRLERWGELAPERGLAEATVGNVSAGGTGIEAVVHTSGRLTPAALAKKADAVRALLEVPTDIRIEIRAGARGDQALLKIRTRSLDIDTTWAPGRVGLGVDTDTGQPVDVSDDDRMLVCGASGSGKSWALRPLMARTVLSGRDHLVYIDGKGEEGRLWQGKGRVATSAEDITELVQELCQEMADRAEAMQGSVWTGPRIMVVIDEGRVVLAGADKDTVRGLVDIASLGRSRGVVLRWCTQYPVTSGSAPGVHQQIAPNVDRMFALRVKSETHARVALDDDADYGPQHIGLDQRGHGYLGDYGPTLIQTWTMDDAAVESLPDREPWEYTGEAEAVPAPGMPGVLAAALRAVEGRPGIKSEDLARALAMDLLDMQDGLRDAGVKAGRFTDLDGVQRRGYPVEAFEEAAARYNQ